jgi:hypothetical protein
MAKIAEDRRQADMADDRERDKAETEALLKAADIAGKYGIQVDQAQIRMLVDRERNIMQHDRELQAQGLQERMAQQSNELQGQQGAMQAGVQAELGQQKNAVQQRLGEQKNELQNQVAMKAAQARSASNGAA